MRLWVELIFELLPRNFENVWFLVIFALKQRRRRRQRERQKGIGLISEAKSLHLHHAFLYISLTSLHDYNVKVPESLAAKLAFPYEFVKEIGLTERRKGKTLGGEGTFITNYFINFSLRYKRLGNAPSIMSQIFPEKLSGPKGYKIFTFPFECKLVHAEFVRT